MHYRDRLHRKTLLFSSFLSHLTSHDITDLSCEPTEGVLTPNVGITALQLRIKKFRLYYMSHFIAQIQFFKELFRLIYTMSNDTS